mmetsp:Transcript_9677/g.13828  ORF Transcript_9677/g.13828 Transcript_9677/m.13828 type:complete len:247 (+) Transcript_9677:116-856(+)
MKMLSKALFGFLVVSFSCVVGAFQLPSGSDAPRSATTHHVDRKDFLATSASVITGAVLVNSQPANARGRATLEQAYDRYTPRIVEGGQFYKSDLYAAISKSNWKAIQAATAEPPKKSKEDRALQDGGFAKRAALAGGFSNARVLSAMDLYAGSFSDSSISAKTKAMKAEVETLREVVEGMNKAAKIALGEESAGGGLFGIGSKKPSTSELAKQLQELYIKGGNAYNAYIFAANEGLPLQLKKMPFL